MATRKKTSSSASRSAAKSTRRANPPARTTRRKVPPAPRARTGTRTTEREPPVADDAEIDERDERVDEERPEESSDEERGGDAGVGDDSDDDETPAPPPSRRPVAPTPLPTVMQRFTPMPTPPAAMPPTTATPRPAGAPLARPMSASAGPVPTAPPTPIVRTGPRPFLVARGEDALRVFGETLKHSGFFEVIENAQIKSGKRREVFEVACKVDFMRGVRVEPEPVSYVDPKLVTYLFNQLLDRGFRILRIVETRGELSRYVMNRSVKNVGRVLGFDESCYELKDLCDELAPIDLGPTLGRRATGRYWKQSDFRIVFAKNRTDEHFGPALTLWNIWHTLAGPSDLLALEYGIDVGELVMAMLEKLPVHFALIDAIHSRDGSPGNVFPYEVLRATQPSGSASSGAAANPLGDAEIQGAQIHRPGTILAGMELLAVEAAGQKMQGIDATTDPICLAKLRKLTGWKPPAEVDGLPTFPGWKGIGTRIREAIGSDRAVDATRLSILASLVQVDGRLFPPHASAYQAIRLRNKVALFAEELRRRHGVGVAAGSAGHAPDAGFGPDAGGDEGDDDDDPPSFQ